MEEGKAAVIRQRGHCELGICHPHNKPALVHHASAPCDVHGRPKTRGGANLWTTV